jgi:hypothetical protein
MYTPGMSVMSLLLKNRYESKRSLFIETENASAFSLFLKKNFSDPSEVLRNLKRFLWAWTIVLENRHVYGCGQGCFLVSPYLVLLHQ